MVLLAIAAAATPLWLDELHQLVGTYDKTFAQMLHWAQASPGGTPLNFLAQKIVVDVLGFSAFSARLPAVLFASGSLWMFIRIAREYVQDRWLLATAIFAFLPQIFRYGFEARPYSQGLFFVLIAFWSWLRLERVPSRRDTIAFGLAVAGGLYSQVFSVFIPAGLGAWSVRNSKSRVNVLTAIAAAAALYLPWFLVQRATQAVTQTMDKYSFSWQQLSTLGYIKELSGGGYFCSVPLIILAALGRDLRLVCVAAFGLALPIAADATLGYFFAGRQLIFALPFLILLAAKGASAVPRWAAYCLILPLFIASATIDYRQATTVREDWSAPARTLAMSKVPCTYVWTPEQLQYLQVYAPSLKQCDLSSHPAEVLYITTRYSPPAGPPAGYAKIHSERVGVAEIALYRSDDSLKTYGLSRFLFRP